MPRYQRNYAWGTDEVDALLKDLDACRRGRSRMERRDHFFGGIVTAILPAANTNRPNLELIDGQQRLATFLMLATQVARAMDGLADILAEGPDRERLAAYLRERATMLGARYGHVRDNINFVIVDVPRLTLSKPDRDFFERVLKGEAPVAARTSHRLLAKAFETIGSHLAGILAEASDDIGRVQALDLVDKVFEIDWTVIHMAADRRSDAYMLFQVLNDRGASLTEGELLRASTLEALDPIATAGDMTAVEEAWDEMLGIADLDVREVLEWIFESRVGRRPSRATLLADMEAIFFPAIGTGHALDADAAAATIATVVSMREDFVTLSSILQGEWPKTIEDKRIDAWDRDRLRLLVVHLKQQDCLPLLVAATALGATRFSAIVRILECFCFRYAVLVGGPRAAALEVLDRHAAEIRRDASSYGVGTLQSELRALLGLHASDEVFRARLQAFGYPRSASRKPLKYFLMTIEHFVRWYDEGANGRPDCRDRMRILDFENGTIEHVHPENADLVDAELDPLIDTLGNLTILSPAENTRIGAKPFVNKKAVLSDSTVTLNQQIAAEDAWTAAVVRRRHERLCDIALKVFAI